jgi:hypothetical protein
MQHLRASGFNVKKSLKKIDMPNRRKMVAWKEEYILDHHETMTATEISRVLKVTDVTVAAYAKSLGVKCLVRPAGQRVNQLRISVGRPKIVEREEPKPQISRPPAVYGNSPTPYGIADELYQRSLIHRSQYQYQ